MFTAYLPEDMARDPNRQGERCIPVEGLLAASRTSDRGLGFTLLNEGLPTDLAYELVCRRAIAVAGDPCAGGKLIAAHPATLWRAPRW